MNKDLQSNSQEMMPIQHIVCFKFLKRAKPKEIENLKASFISLQNKIPGILSITGGQNNSPENLNKGFSHGFVITFENEQARSEYLPHPEHQNFVSQLKPLMEDVFVIDFSFKI
jgi:hypothetical protein